ncbi:RHS repeat-associated core domain-containing protein [Pseudomonas sichuanensis]|uniref:RHS repeat-associated core domain-containing protein n=1 Tax=Pseudomonas sichuanensis TaxID=2213015 RepID=UPI00244A22B9|nr:RHS repeat-associated core domain-containing protein [Pseudomonas sichuanensis]MDH1582409.1 RHS repeat-associated core domain-containing protein [Pseudomonas sichuanensis]MDH1591806.1 RHS repeat-associated core domain-containing protein [Pseudomonas sichuanensis]MDH1599699.1 RHS repeat-associated core domain-containing protein [Pseudomonas sichuanensis]
MKKQANTTHFFYQNGKLVTVSQGAQHRAIFRTVDMPLAEQHSGEDNHLLVIDDKNSVIGTTDEKNEPRAYSTYGHDPNIRLEKSILGFNGEHLEKIAQYYLLGTGHHRTYSTPVMRFLSADSLSPFGEGGINAYAYCNGDPVNYVDPSGHVGIISLLKGIGNLLKLREKGSSAKIKLKLYEDKSENKNKNKNDLITAEVDRLQTQLYISKHEKFTSTKKSPHGPYVIKRTDFKGIYQEIADDAYFAANRQTLRNYGRKIKTGEVPRKDLDRTTTLRSLDKSAGEEAERLRALN